MFLSPKIICSEGRYPHGYGKSVEFIHLLFILLLFLYLFCYFLVMENVVAAVLLHFLLFCCYNKNKRNAHFICMIHFSLVIWMKLYVHVIWKEHMAIWMKLYIHAIILMSVNIANLISLLLASWLRKINDNVYGCEILVKDG